MLSGKALFKQISDWLGHYGKIKNLIGLITFFGSCAAAYWQSGMIPSTWSYPRQWTWVLLWFSGSAFAILFSLYIIEYVATSLRRRFFPPVLYLTAEGGAGEAMVTIKCTKGSSVVRVDGRIVRTVNGSPNPFPQLFPCRMSLLGHAQDYRFELTKGQWAHIQFARVVDSRIEHWLIVDCDTKSIRIPDKGAIIEFRMTGDFVEMKKQYKVSLITQPRLYSGAERRIDVSDVV